MANVLTAARPKPYRSRGGQIDLFFADPFAAGPFLSGGQIKVLAITDTSRLQSLPNVPTVAEAGFKGVELVSWAAVFAPAKTDPAIVERLNREINKILATPQAGSSSSRWVPRRWR